jgi:acyl carrier protein
MSESKQEDYKSIFIESLGIEQKDFNTEIKYNEITEWDSIGHMTLISALEEKFKITFETDDIVDFSSYKEGLKILKKYKIDI